MGKSLNNAIYLSDDLDTISKKVMSAVTDPSKIKKDMKANPTKCMVGYYHDLFSNEKDIVFSECKNGLRGCVDCKKQLATNIYEHLKPIQEKRKYYENNINLVDDIILRGNEKARLKAKDTMKKVRKSMRIDYFEGE